MRLIGFGSLSLLLVIGVAGCGDDDGTPDTGGGDTGADTGTDTNVPDTNVPDTAVADVGADAGTRDECDPFAAAPGCGDGLKCTVVLDIDPEGAVTDVFFGCVDDSRMVSAGVPCSLNVDATPDDTTDDARGDNCAEGLFCTSFGNEPGDRFARCQPMCDGEMTDCGDNSFCLGLNGDPFFGTCMTADGCDPVLQDCTDDRACYVFGTTSGDVVGDCWDWEAAEGSTGAAGSACQQFDQCQPGASCRNISDTEAECLGFCQAPAVPVDGGVDAAVPDAAVADAGADAAVADAGPGPAECVAPEECLPLEAEEGAAVLLPTPAGFCAEPPPAM